MARKTGSRGCTDSGGTSEEHTQSRVFDIRRKQNTFLRRLTAVRFHLGFSRLSDTKSLLDGRFLHLSGDFENLIDENGTRAPLNDVPLRELDGPYSFVVITDPHITCADTRGFERVADMFVPSDAFAVVNGDLTRSGSREQLETFLAMAGRLPVPCYPVIGNHDIYFHSWPVWKQLMGTTIYRVDSGTTTLLMLDSANGRFGLPQIDWLQTQLESARERIFVFSHCNFFIPRATTIQQFAALWERSVIVRLFADKVSAVFTGHSHKRYVHTAENVPYINTDDFKTNASFCRVYVTPGGVRYEYGNLETDGRQTVQVPKRLAELSAAAIVRSS